MLININEEMPKEFFVFVNFSNPIAANNYKVGAYTSAACSTWLNEETLKKYIDGTLTYLPFIPANRDVTARKTGVRYQFPLILETIGI